MVAAVTGTADWLNQTAGTLIF